MAMIRIELENDRRRLPMYLAAAGVIAIVAALYGIDRQVGLLHVLNFDAVRQYTGSILQDSASTVAAEAGHGNAAAGDRSASVTQSADAPLPMTVAIESAPVSQGRSQPRVTRPAVATATVVAQSPAESAASTPVTWWQTAQRMSRRLPRGTTVTRHVSHADGTFRLEGTSLSNQHDGLRQSVGMLHDLGLQPTLTFWRAGTSASTPSFAIQGFAGSDAPRTPPQRASMHVDALVHLAQDHARTAGLLRLSTLRPTHETWSPGNTRVEQGLSAVGDRSQVAAFGMALASESQVRLTSFSTESIEGGLLRVTASIDVLLGKEPSR